MECAENMTHRVDVCRCTAAAGSSFNTALFPAPELTLWNMAQMAARGWWMVATMVWPRVASMLMCSMMLSAAKLSSPAFQEDQLQLHKRVPMIVRLFVKLPRSLAPSLPVVGSSMKMIEGLAIRLQAIESRRFSPPAQI